MKTLTLPGCITCLAVCLSGCGTDPVVLGELLAAARESPQAGEGSAPPLPDEPVVPDPDDPDPDAPYPAQPDPDEPDIDEPHPLEAEVMDILQVNCAACHTGPDAAIFDYVDDLDRMIESDLALIVAGSRIESRIYVRMEAGTMPPFIDGQRPTPEEIELVGQFIDELE